MSDAPPAATPAASNRGQLRRRLFTGLGLVVTVAAIGWFLYWLLVASNYVSTDNAYVGADVAQITPQVAGAVTEVHVADTQRVKTGDVLAVIDPADAQVAAERAEAGYGSAVRRVQQNFGVNDQLSAQIAARDADIAHAKAQVTSAESDVAKTKVDLDRRQALSATGAVSGEELTTAKNAYQTAVANLAAAKASDAAAAANRKAAQGQYEAQAALTKGVSITANPDVQTAKATLDAAKLDLSRTVLRAPIDGVVAKRNVQVGQRVTVGAQLMTVVPIDQVYVDANFKEVQLKQVHPGQPVELTADLYGKGVKYHGRVIGFSGGTGSAFAVIPAQNATGNWIKVVQRLPVRIALDPRELHDHPLRVGLSMDVKIDIKNPSRGAGPSA
jgi:membrane fusion protein (multidrug efflux system)